MKTSMLAALTALTFALTAWAPATPVRAQAAPGVKGDDDCPPLAKARQLGLLQKVMSKGELPCDKGKLCDANVKVWIENNVCYAAVEKEKIIVKKKPGADDPSNKDKSRSDVPKITWKLIPVGDVGNSKFEFHDQDGILFLKPKEPKEPDDDVNRPEQDYWHDPKSKPPGKQAFEWDNKHLRKVRLRYCPYVFRIYKKDGKEERQECAGADPLILNQ